MRVRDAARFLVALTAAIALVPHHAAAQATTRGLHALRPELRADALLGERSAAHLGVGGVAPVGTYLRLTLLGTAGVSGGWPTDPELRASGRVELLARFLLDPFGDQRRAPYAGGGVSARFDAHARERTYLVVLIGVEGAPRNGLVPAIEVGVGGGWRLGVVLRGERERSR